MLHTITKRLEICIDINIEISEILLNKYEWLLSYSQNIENLISGGRGEGGPNKSGDGGILENLKKK